MQGKVLGKTGGVDDKINGIIEEYVAQGNISAGGFVEYINNYEIGEDTALNNSSNYTGSVISAVALSDTKVFIAHSHGSSSNNFLYAMVCTIENNTITVGTDTVLNNSSTYTGSVISAVALSNNKVFIAHSYSNSYYLYAMVCTISRNNYN